VGVSVDHRPRGRIACLFGKRPVCPDKTLGVADLLGHPRADIALEIAADLLDAPLRKMRFEPRRQPASRADRRIDGGSGISQ